MTDQNFTLADVEAYERDLAASLSVAGVDHDIWHDEDGDEGWHITIEAGDEQTLSGGGCQRETVLGWWTRDDTWYWTFVDQHGEPCTIPARELNDGAGPDVVAEFVRYHSGQEDPASPAPAGGAS